MDKIRFTDEDGESVELYVLEETTVSEIHYLLLAEDEEGDSDAYIFKQVSEDGDDQTYEPVEDDAEFESLIKIFEELVEDTDFE